MIIKLIWSIIICFISNFTGRYRITLVKIEIICKMGKYCSKVSFFHYWYWFCDEPGNGMGQYHPSRALLQVVCFDNSYGLGDTLSALYTQGFLMDFC